MDMGSFKIDGTEFGIGNIKLSLDNGLLNLQVTGDSSIFDRLMDNGGRNGTGHCMHQKYTLIMYHIKEESWK